MFENLESRNEEISFANDNLFWHRESYSRSLVSVQPVGLLDEFKCVSVKLKLSVQSYVNSVDCQKKCDFPGQSNVKVILKEWSCRTCSKGERDGTSLTSSYNTLDLELFSCKQYLRQVTDPDTLFSIPKNVCLLNFLQQIMTNVSVQFIQKRCYNNVESQTKSSS